jgi:hypothetical protein
MRAAEAVGRTKSRAKKPMQIFVSAFAIIVRRLSVRSLTAFDFWRYAALRIAKKNRGELPQYYVENDRAFFFLGCGGF